MIAAFPMDPLTVQCCFPDQPQIEAVAGQRKVELSHLLAALECGKLFNAARFWLLVGTLSFEQSFVDCGVSMLKHLLLAARDLTADTSYKDHLQDQITTKADQLLDSFNSEDFAETFTTTDVDGDRFNEVAGSFVASFELLELGITRFCVFEELKLLWSLGIHLDQARHLGPHALQEAHQKQIANEEIAAGVASNQLSNARSYWLAALKKRCNELGVACNLDVGPEGDFSQALARLEQQIIKHLPSLVSPTKCLPAPAGVPSGPCEDRSILDKYVTVNEFQLAQGTHSTGCSAPWQSVFPELDVYRQEFRITAPGKDLILPGRLFNLVFFS
jgi:hypothetical protein